MSNTPECGLFVALAHRMYLFRGSHSGVINCFSKDLREISELAQVAHKIRNLLKHKALLHPAELQ